MPFSPSSINVTARSQRAAAVAPPTRGRTESRIQSSAGTPLDGEDLGPALGMGDPQFRVVGVVEEERATLDACEYEWRARET